MPKTAVSAPSGKGGSSGVPSTKWVSGTWKGRVSRPGSASASAGIAVLSRKRKLISIDCNVRSADGARLFRAGTHGGALPRGDERDAPADLAREVRARLLRPRPRGRLVLPPDEERDLPRAAHRRDVRGGGGAAARGDASQHPPHQRRRPPAAPQPREPGLHAARGGPLASGDARVPRAPVGAARGNGQL